VSLRRESSVTCILEKLRSSAIGLSVSRLDTYSPSFEYWTSDPDPVELDGFPARVVFVASVRNGVVSKPPFGPDAAASSQWGTYSLPLPRCNPDCPKPRCRSARRWDLLRVEQGYRLIARMSPRKVIIQNKAGHEKVMKVSLFHALDHGSDPECPSRVPPSAEGACGTGRHVNVRLHPAGSRQST